MSDTRSRRVVITGVGLVSPLGNDKQEYWNALQAGESAVRPLRSIPISTLPMSYGAETDFTGHIREFGDLEDPQKKAIRKGLKVMCREIQMGVAASQLALQDAQLGMNDLDRDRTGVVFGSDYIMTMPCEFTEGIRSCLAPSGTFQFERWADQGLTKITPLWLLKYLPNMPACHVAIYNDLRGPNNSITVKEASSNLALAEAFCTIQRGHADAMLSGATGTRIHPIKSIHVALQEELATDSNDPHRASRPFDAGRTGMVVGEGAASVVLEELAHAQRRGAEILAEVVGFGSSAVMDPDGMAHRDRALINAMQQALRTAGIRPEDVGHVNAHGISSVKGDREEAHAIQQVFADCEQSVPVVAPKSYFGNVGAAGGTLELIASILAINNGNLFATLNYEQVDPDCPVAVVTSNDQCAGKSALNLSVTPHGQASTLLISRFA